jgi:hypothetical protein
MMRSRLALLLLLFTGLWAASWFVDAAYFAPSRLATNQVAGLRDALLQLRTREVETARLLGQVTTPVDPALIADLAPGGSQASAMRLQDEILEAIASAGGLALSSQPVSVDLGGGHTKISLLIRARFDEAGMLLFLRDRESSRPITFIENLDVHSLPLPGDTKPLDMTATFTKLHADVASS